MRSSDCSPISQCAAARRFVERGGALIATGASSQYTEWGDSRGDFALAALFGASASSPLGRRRSAPSAHTYLRLAKERHPVLRGFEETDKSILPKDRLRLYEESGRNPKVLVKQLD